jgi:hypothetical protein
MEVINPICLGGVLFLGVKRRELAVFLGFLRILSSPFKHFIVLQDPPQMDKGGLQKHS